MVLLNKSTARVEKAVQYLVVVVKDEAGDHEKIVE